MITINNPIISANRIYLEPNIQQSYNLSNLSFTQKLNEDFFDYKIKPKPRYINDNEYLYDVEEARLTGFYISRIEDERNGKNELVFKLKTKDSEKDKISSLATSSNDTYILEIKKDLNSLLFTGKIKPDLIPCFLYSAIKESIRLGFEGCLIVKIPESIFLNYESYGFKTIDAMKNFSNIYQILQPKDAIKTLSNLQEYFDIYYTKTHTDIKSMARRGYFISLPVNQEFIIGQNQDINVESYESNGILGKIKINQDGTALLTEYKRNSIKVNASEMPNESINTLYNKKIQKMVIPGNVLTIGNEDFVFTSTGLRQISNDSKELKKLFPKSINNLDFEQSNISGHCYLLSTLRSLSYTPEGVEILAHLIKPLPNNHYIVRFPGFPEDSFNFDLNKPNSLIKVTPTHSLGLKLIENAFLQLRQKYGWTVMKPSEKELLHDDPSKWLYGGFPEDVMYVLTAQKGVHLPFSVNESDNENQIKKAKQILQEITNSTNMIAVASTLNNFDHPEVPFIVAHGYSVVKVDPKKECIYLSDPHNSSQNMFYKNGTNDIRLDGLRVTKVSYKDFFKYFDGITYQKLSLPKHD